MRITEQQRKVIVNVAHQMFGESASVRLFGSRADDAKRGGDIDLYIEPQRAVGALEIARARRIMEDALEIKVDLVVKNGDLMLPIFDIAKRTGVML